MQLCEKFDIERIKQKLMGKTQKSMETLAEQIEEADEKEKVLIKFL